MKKILSCVLAVVMLAGMLTFGASTEAPDMSLKFNDILLKGGGGDVGMANYSDANINANGFTVVMDFVYGRSGICYHPIDATLKHSSKFAMFMGQSEGTCKYVGYSATEEAFFVGVCANSPVYGEGADGIEYLALSEKGLVKPGVEYRVAYEFVADTGINIYVDGNLVVSFDLYEDLDYPTYFAYPGYIMMYPTHITCFLDNVALYTPGTYDPTTDEATAAPSTSNNFDTDAQVKEVVETDEAGNVVSTKYLVEAQNFQIVNDAYSLVDPEYDVYAQPQYGAAEDQANIIFQSGLNKKANGADEIFATGKDFTIDLTMKNNKGIDSVTLDLVSDAAITVKEVKAADGLTAALGETDANGVTKLTITGQNYTGEALATITYALDDTVVQDLTYSYGALTDTVAVTGATTDVVLTNGASTVYNYTIGDMNDDGNFNLADVTTILKLVAKWDLPGVFKEAGDVNGDGRTNGMDSSYFMRWIAKWPGYTINGVTYY